MNARERKLLAQGINPLNGQALTAPVLAPAGPARVAHATQLAPWIVEAKAQPHAIEAPSPVVDRIWYDTGERGTSNSGRDTIVLLSGMKNGGFFRATFPGDAVRAIAAGKVLGQDGKVVKLG